MKKTAFTVILVLSTAFRLWADAGESLPVQAKKEAVQVKKEATLKTTEADFMTGVVDKVLLADLTRSKSKIDITDAKGAKSEFAVKALAVIYTESGEMLTLGTIRPGTKVEINYRTGKDGAKEASAIKVLK